MPHPTRRDALRSLGATLVLPFTPRIGAEDEKPLRVGMIADLHHGLEPTALPRLEEFVAQATATEADAIVQLGDFNFATKDDAPCMKTWRSFKGDRIHVLGNHDMDKVTKQEAQDYWQMEQRYHSFDRSGFHFVILDRNNLRTDEGDVPYAKGNYFAHPGSRSYADREQLEWLTADLASTTLPTVVLVHQGLGMVDDLPATDPRHELESILAASEKVIACFCGHEHLDRHRQKDDIHYVWINSASYYWVGSKYGRMAPYEDALFAFATFDPAGEIRIEGRASEFVSPTPTDRGFPRATEISASITSRTLSD